MAVCPRCGQENPEVARFCLACAAPLRAPRTAEGEERKLVTCLFVDLVGSTASAEHADPEDVRARLREYHERVRREVERHGGTLEKFAGDAVLAVFGAPIAHEDDPERAVRAGLRALDAVADLGLEARAAVNTGEAVVAVGARPAEGEALVAGDVVNTAARLQQSAPAGALVAGEVTYRATGAAIRYEELEPLKLKGKAAPVAVWRAIEARGRFGVDAEPAAGTPFVGREHDLALLKETYARALRERGVQLVTVAGEPGVGKTRLLAEVRAWLDDQPDLVRWRQGRCLPYGEGITFWALGEIVKGEAGILESDSPEEASAKLAAAVAGVVDDRSEREWLLSRLAPLVGGELSEAAAERSESFVAWRTFLEALAAERPLVLVVEDLHWADPALVEFLEHVADWSSDVPLLALCTARPELYERHSGWGGGKRNSTTISLSPLSEEETARLVAALLDRAVLPAETQVALLERAEGNPLYAEEFVRMLVDRGIVTERGDLAAAGEIPVPETVHGLIAARLDTIAPERKALLHDAAVVGKVFWTGAVAAVGGADRDAVLAGVRELVRKELVRPARRTSIEHEEEFSFWHLLVRDVAYGQIPRAARARKHRAAAEWVESIAGERVADHAELLAQHYTQAIELARAAGEDVHELEARAARFIVLAGDRAVYLDAVKARAHYSRALDLIPAREAEHPHVLAKLAETEFNIEGPTEEAVRWFEQAVADFRARGDKRPAAKCLGWLARIAWARGETVRAHELTDEALGLLEGEPPSPELAFVLDQRTAIHVLGGRAREGLETSERALVLAEQLALDDRRVRSLQFRGIARLGLGDVGGQRDLEESLRLGLETGFAAETTLAYINLAFWRYRMEGPARGLELSQEGAAFAERRGLMGFWAWIWAESTWMLVLAGDWDRAVELADRILDETDEEIQLHAIAAFSKARVSVHRGNADEAAAIVDSHLERTREIADPQVFHPALCVAALVEDARGRTAAAVGRIEELVDVSRGDVRGHRAEELPSLVPICAVAGRLDLAERLFDGLETAVVLLEQHGIAGGRAALAEARGELEEAAALYEEVAARWEAFGAPFERARALLGRARCLLALGRAAEAAAPLQAARATFTELGARPLLGEAERLGERAA
jgi:class 3 adenylate cyclase/tetratricopeptide (TPR) repeat protein